MDDDAAIPLAGLASLNDDPLLRRLPAYLVGGAVRDCLLRGLPSADARRLSSAHAFDLDILVPSDGVRIARQLADRLKGAFYTLDALRDVCLAVLGRATAGGQRHMDEAA